MKTVVPIFRRSVMVSNLDKKLRVANGSFQDVAELLNGRNLRAQRSQ